jgi:putative transposase
VAERFVQLVKPERIVRLIYPRRDQARQDILNDIEAFYNRKRKHAYNNMLPPIVYKR